jgi:hypothetical protein
MTNAFPIGQIYKEGLNRLNNGVRFGFSILFPINEKKKYEKLVDIIDRSFKPSFGE